MSSAESCVAVASGSLRLVGRVRLLDRSGRELPLATRKVRALLAIVALSSEGAATRTRLASQLWGDRGDAQARASLRQALHDLRRILSDAGLAEALQVDRDGVVLDRALISIDALIDPALASSLDLSVLMPRVERWQADLMEDLDGITPEVDDWLREARTHRKARLVDAVMNRLLREPASAEVLRLAQLVVALDPANEPAHRLMMRVQAAQQNVGGALAHYQRLEHFFQREFGSEPHQATKSAAHGLAEAGAPAFALPMVAVGNPLPRLQLVAISESAGDDVASGLGAMLLEDLAFMLERSQEVDVVLGDATTEADGDLVLSASFRATPVRMRVYLGLRRPGEQVRRWSERFDLKIDPHQSLDDHVVARMSTSVLSGVTRQMAALRAPSDDSTADGYRLFSKARHLVDVTPDRTRLRAALPLLEESVAADPHNLIARIYLVRLLNTQLFETEVGADPAAWRRQARDIAAASYDLDPRSAVANVVMGWCHLWQRRFDDARWYIEQALELNPYHPERQTDAATAFMYLGDHARAAACLAAARAMEPQPIEQISADAIEIKVMCGHFDEALQLAHRIRNLNVKRLAWLCVGAGLAGETATADDARTRMIGLGRDLWIGSQPFSTERLVDWLFHHMPFADERETTRFRAQLLSPSIKG